LPIRLDRVDAARVTHDRRSIDAIGQAAPRGGPRIRSKNYDVVLNN
jgi:hypothetical protein